MLKKLWANRDLEITQIAARFGVRPPQVYAKAMAVGLQKRGFVKAAPGILRQIVASQNFDIHDKEQRQSRLNKTPFREESGVRIYECPRGFAEGYRSDPKW